ncbi:MAG: tyrosine-type recombinase/integrase [Acidimicrobiales bacterium]
MRGFIRQRGTTYTAYWSTVEPATGKRRQHTKGGFARKEPARPPKGDSAREFLNSIVGSVSDGTWRPDARTLTVRGLLEDHWLPAQRSRGLRPSTLAQYATVTAWIVPVTGGVRAAALTPRQVTDMADALRSTETAAGRSGLSARSTQLAVGVLKASTAWALANGLLGRDPIAGVRRPRAETPEMRAWSADDARTFLAATRDDRLGWAWALLLARGLRRGEVCGLRWSDIDLEGGSARITRTRILVEGRPASSSPKTRAGRRVVPLDASLVAVLRAHRGRQAAEQLAAGEAYTGDGWLFSDELGVPYYPDSLSEWFARDTQAHGLPRIRLHDCRHTAATLMLASAVPVKVVSEMLGHASPAVTLAVYAHVLPGIAEEAGAALSASLLG